MTREIVRFGARFLCYCAIALLLSIRARAIATELNDAERLDKLQQRWDDQRTSIQTAVIEYRSVKRYAQPQPKRGAVVTLLANADLAGNVSSLRGVITSLDTKLKGQPVLWSDSRFTLDITGNARNDSSVPGHTSSDMRVGEDTISKRADDPQGRSQIDVTRTHTSGSMYVPTIGDFCMTPSRKFCEHAAVVHDKEISRAGWITIRSDKRECVVDGQTGFVFKYREGDPTDRSCSEVIQYGPTTYPGDILLPAATFSGDYRFGVLEKFSIHVIDRAVVNEGVDPATFATSGDKGDTVVDRRGKKESVTTVEDHVSDILGP